MNARADWVSTDAVAKAAGVVPATLTRWAERGLLPQPTKIFRGRKGNRHIWPPSAVEQAGWVSARLSENWTHDEILAALQRGDFKPAGPPDDADPAPG